LRGDERLIESVSFALRERLCSWMKHETARTGLPVRVEFNCEATSG